jgi:hypothetical protein
VHEHATAGQPTLTWFERVAQHRRAIIGGRIATRSGWRSRRSTAPWAAYYVNMGLTAGLGEPVPRAARGHVRAPGAGALRRRDAHARALRCTAFQAHAALASWAELVAAGGLQADDAPDPAELAGAALLSARELGLAGVERFALGLPARLGFAPP